MNSVNRMLADIIDFANTHAWYETYALALLVSFLVLMLLSFAIGEENAKRYDETKFRYWTVEILLMNSLFFFFSIPWMPFYYGYKFIKGFLNFRIFWFLK